MSQSVSSVSPAQVGAVSMVIGGGIGYAIAPEKYNLEQLLTQSPDVFEKSLPKKVMADKKYSAAYNSIVDARNTVKDALMNNKIETKLAELIRAPKLEKAYSIIREQLPKARVQNAILVGVIAGILATFTKILFGNSNN